MAGYVAQVGGWTDSAPGLLALPLGVSVLPSILLTGCLDLAADAAAAKRILVVFLGKRGAVRLAIAAGLAAPAVAALRRSREKIWLHCNARLERRVQDACASHRTVHIDRQLRSWDAAAKIAPGLGVYMALVHLP